MSFFPRQAAAAAPAADELDARFAKAEALEESNPEAAEATYRHVLVDDPTYAHPYINLGFMLCEQGRCEEAAALYEDGLRFCPDDPLMHFNRAAALEGLGDVDGALASYEEALRLQPDLVDAHRNAPCSTRMLAIAFSFAAQQACSFMIDSSQSWPRREPSRVRSRPCLAVEI